MAQVSNQTLRQNPFQTIRDPETGRWIVVYPENLADHTDAEEQGTEQAVSVVVQQVSTAA
ncbi:MAG: hypothetical protein F6K30_21165 [Cyanothece sp. SIO2G6]|nr:hypothetical protein [Cyanothece sp. SIO2G6]